MKRTDINKIQDVISQFFWYRQSFGWINISSLRDHPSKKRKTIWNVSQGASKESKDPGGNTKRMGWLTLGKKIIAVLLLRKEGKDGDLMYISTIKGMVICYCPR